MSRIVQSGKSVRVIKSAIGPMEFEKREDGSISAVIGQSTVGAGTNNEPAKATVLDREQLLQQLKLGGLDSTEIAEVLGKLGLG